MSTLTVEKRNNDLSYSTLTSFRINEGERLVLKLTLNDETPHTFKLWASCVGNADPNNAGNKQGKEAANEGWLQVRIEGESVWNNLTFPASFPNTFAALSCFEFALAGPVYLEFQLVLADDVESVGDIAFNLAFRGVPS